MNGSVKSIRKMAMSGQRLQKNAQPVGKNITLSIKAQFSVAMNVWEHLEKSLWSMLSVTIAGNCLAFGLLGSSVGR